MRAIKIFLLLIIIVFFTPLFSISCGSNYNYNNEITVSGFELSFGKTIGEYRQNGNLSAILIIAPSVILLILSFFIYKTKKIFLYKNLFFIIPMFNIFAAFTLRYIVKYAAVKRIRSIAPDIINTASIINTINIRIQPGFVLYIIFNAAVLILSSVNYFININQNES